MGDLIGRKEHKIKIKKKYYDAVLKGEKTFEIRKNDRDYKVGDIIFFVPISDECEMIIPYNKTLYKITYIFHGGEYGLEKGYCVFGIAPVDAFPVLRCKDCGHWGIGVAGETEHVKCCEYGKYMVGENGYCVYGERK